MDFIVNKFSRPPQEVLDCGEAILVNFVKNYSTSRYTHLLPNIVALKLASDSLNCPLMMGDEILTNDLLVGWSNCTHKEFHSLLIAMYASSIQNSLPIRSSIREIASRCEFPQITTKCEELFLIAKEAIGRGESLQLNPNDIGTAAFFGAIVYLISKVAQLRLKIFIIALESRVPTASISQAAAFLEMCPSVKAFIKSFSQDDILLSSIKEMGKQKRSPLSIANISTLPTTHIPKDHLLKEHYLLEELGYSPFIF